MRNFKITLEYDGTGFNGWQVQPNNQRSVQGDIEKILHRILKTKTRLIGSGRTDRGVHAFGQVANFKAQTRLSPDQLMKALNANLPEDISVLAVKEVAANFHAQHSVKAKTYRYTILNRLVRSAPLRKFCLHIPQRLNTAAMRREAKALIGRKDFRSFTATDPKRDQSNTVRTVKKLTIRKSGDLLIVDIEANGFLYKMVRGIIGTLLEAGRGRLPAGSVRRILAKKDRRAAPATAKPHGLCLLSVRY